MSNYADLVKNFPSLFKSDDFYFEINSGWYDLLYLTLQLIERRLNEWAQNDELKSEILAKNEPLSPWLLAYFKKNAVDPATSFEISQIKEKFGGLRIYYHCDERIPYIDGIINTTEGVSYQVCELCGEKGQLIKGGYLKTRCIDCLKMD